MVYLPVPNLPVVLESYRSKKICEISLQTETVLASSGLRYCGRQFVELLESRQLRPSFAAVKYEPTKYEKANMVF